jgi:predicted metallo-beta-lactamase superfamily hydrolase
MKIIPIAFDSLGTRAMATYIETETLKILIDPSVRLAPLRFNLSPHPLEEKRKDEHWQDIVNYAKNCDILIITHYHYDHYNPDVPELFKDKIAIIKHPTENINESQKECATVFLDKIRPLVKKIEIGDSNKFTFKGVKIICSQPVFHGTSYHLGFVFETLIDDGRQKFLIPVKESYYITKVW